MYNVCTVDLAVYVFFEFYAFQNQQLACRQYVHGLDSRRFQQVFIINYLHHMMRAAFPPASAYSKTLRSEGLLGPTRRASCHA
jgi:hypothetical protein